MKQILHLLLVVAPLFAFSETPAPVSCDCPEISCPPCTHKDGLLDFFTEKCGVGGSKTRSCARPKCVDDMTADAKCAKTKPVAASPGIQTNLEPSSTAATKVVGSIKVVKGHVQIVGADGAKKIVAAGDPVHERDALVTSEGGGALIEFQGGNRVHVLEKTRVKIQQYDSTPDNKEAVFNLIKGKIRNQVKEKYDGKTSKYEVITPGVVAGVRGTDFVISHEESDIGFTRVDTLKGEVHLTERLGDNEAAVPAGHSETYVLNRSDGGPNETGWTNPPSKGAFGELKEIPPAQMAVLARVTNLDGSSPQKPKVDEPVCNAPAGKFNQCLWKCKGNPKKAKTCRTDLSGVECVRLRCNANGEWTEPTRLPASESDACKPDGVVVDQCDY